MELIIFQNHYTWYGEYEYKSVTTTGIIESTSESYSSSSINISNDNNDEEQDKTEIILLSTLVPILGLINSKHVMEDLINIIINYINKQILNIKKVNNQNETLVKLLSSLIIDIQSIINKDTNNSNNNNNNNDQIDKKIDEFQNLMSNYGVKTIMNKLIAKKKKSTTTTTTTKQLSSNKECILNILKLLSMVEMIILRELQNEYNNNNNNNNNIENIVYCIGDFTQLESLMTSFSKVTLVKFNTLDEFIKTIEEKGLKTLLPSSQRIFINSDIDIIIIKEFLLKFKVSIKKYPITILYDELEFWNNTTPTNTHSEYISLLSSVYNEFEIILSTSHLQIQFFISSMKSKSKYNNYSTTTTTTTSHSNPSSTTTTPISKHENLDLNDNDELTDEDDDKHDESYSKFNLVTASPTLDLSEQQNITPNRSYTIRNMKPSPSNKHTPNKTVVISPQQQQSPTSPTISPSSSTNKIDPSLSRINNKTTSILIIGNNHSHTPKFGREIVITTGKITTINIHLRDALDNPVSTLATVSNSIGFGPIQPTPISISLDGPINELKNVPIYCFVVGPGVIGCSFFATHNGIYTLTATLDNKNLKNCPINFKSIHDPSLSSSSHSTTATNNNDSTPLSKSNQQINNNISLEKKRKLPLLDFETTSNESIDLLDYIDSIDENKKNKSSNTNTNNNNNNNNTNSNNINNNNTNNNNTDIDLDDQDSVDNLINYKLSNNNNNNTNNITTTTPLIINNQITKVVNNDSTSLEISPTIQVEEQDCIDIGGDKENEREKEKDNGNSCEFEATLAV